eukprot:gnl/Chilomastix_cuspidata/6654.p2 GENE.gnl/Chilomastix_cuspidata/6654~~gnl/Chilomastix_cuspidata/6654.p2  ORF type:complete len:358 (-),score=29.88 gnl/Chilomastix_cuspidata/6654:97-1170(-)
MERQLVCQDTTGPYARLLAAALCVGHVGTYEDEAVCGCATLRSSNTRHAGALTAMAQRWWHARKLDVRVAAAAHGTWKATMASARRRGLQAAIRVRARRAAEPHTRLMHQPHPAIRTRGICAVRPLTLCTRLGGAALGDTEAAAMRHVVRCGGARSRRFLYLHARHEATHRTVAARQSAAQRRRRTLEQRRTRRATELAAREATAATRALTAIAQTRARATHVLVRVARTRARREVHTARARVQLCAELRSAALFVQLNQNRRAAATAAAAATAVARRESARTRHMLEFLRTRARQYVCSAGRLAEATERRAIVIQHIRARAVQMQRARAPRLAPKVHHGLASQAAPEAGIGAHTRM